MLGASQPKHGEKGFLVDGCPGWGIKSPHGVRRVSVHENSRYGGLTRVKKAATHGRGHPAMGSGNQAGRRGCSCSVGRQESAQDEGTHTGAAAGCGESRVQTE